MKKKSLRIGQSVEQEIGPALPRDYKESIDVFGTGQSAGFIWVLNPFPTIDHLNLLVHVFDQHSIFINQRFLIKRHDDVYPYPLYPDQGGLLPWGYTDNGDTLFWLTVGDPGSWKIMRKDRRDMFERFVLPVTTFLAKFIKKDLRAILW